MEESNKLIPSLFIWILELGLSSVTILGFPELDLSSIVYHFRRLNDIKLPMLLTMEIEVQ